MIVVANQIWAMESIAMSCEATYSLYIDKKQLKFQHIPYDVCH